MQLRKALISISIIALALVGSIGIGYFGMMMGGMDNMVGCPLMGHDSAVCNMNPLDHLSMWQSMFAAIPVQNILTLLLSLLSLFLFFRFRYYSWLLHPTPPRVYISFDSADATYDPLQRFIARGLMQPKVF